MSNRYIKSLYILETPVHHIVIGMKLSSQCNFTFLDIGYDSKLIFHTSLSYLNLYVNISIQVT